MPQTDNRRRDLAQIHIGLKQIGLSDSDHQALLHQLHGVDSSSKLNARQRGQYIAHLRKLGFKPAPPTSRITSKIDRRLDTSPEMSKARAIWLMMHGIGVVRDPSESALVAWGKRQGKVDALQWQRRPDMLVEGLKKWAMRHLPAWIEQQAQENWPLRPRADTERIAFFERSVHALAQAKFRGVEALFDYYWPVWCALQTPQSTSTLQVSNQ